MADGQGDQGFIALWMARHLFGGALSYMGFGGEGLQVRDVLHADDLYDVIVRQLAELGRKPTQGGGGGRYANVSILEAIELCESRPGGR